MLHDPEVVSVEYISFMWQIEYGFATPGKALWGECSCSVYPRVVMKRSCSVQLRLGSEM